MPVQYQLLAAARINAVMQGLLDPRLLPQQLLWRKRIPLVNAVDEEIMARFQGTIQIADMIADDAAAVTYEMGRFQFETTKIPNLKLGISMTQQMLNQLRRLQGGFAAPEDMGVFTNWENRTIDAVKLGVDQRIEALMVAMLTDGLSYDRLGIKMTNVTWGMPSDLKITPGTGWDTAGSATPVADILGAKLVASVRYGVDLNRVTMSTQAFRYMIATTEYQNKARQYLAPNVSFVNLTLTNLDEQRRLAANVLGLEIELYDARYWSKATQTGAITSSPFLPITKVILTDSRNDNNANVYDFANGVVTESIVSSLMPINIGGSIPVGYGPVAYATGNPDLNPPNITYWGVARGFPRKHLLQASACLTVGNFVDAISTDAPFPV